MEIKFLLRITSTHIAEAFKWTCSYDPEDLEADVIWQDGAVLPSFLSSLRPFQRINHFPGMYAVARKDYLGRHLKHMSRFFRDEYDFFPPTWVLPKDFSDMRSNFNRKDVFIVKPENLSQGQGIFLTKKIEDLPEHCVVQKYITEPLLIEGLKFDIRVYILITACDPMRLFIHKEGLVRLATHQYSKPTNANLNDQYMHLTNYAINKTNYKFRQNTTANSDFSGHKRSLSKYLEVLSEEGHDSNALWRDICDISIKTMCMVQPLLEHLYRASQANDPSNLMCFQILGLDIMLDRNLKPHILEVKIKF